jgi:hypothetical protein
MAGGPKRLQTYAMLHQVRCGFFLRGLEDERNSFFSLAEVESIGRELAMAR